MNSSHPTPQNEQWWGCDGHVTQWLFGLRLATTGREILYTSTMLCGRNDHFHYMLDLDLFHHYRFRHHNSWPQIHKPLILK